MKNLLIGLATLATGAGILLAVDAWPLAAVTIVVLIVAWFVGDEVRRMFS